jgi:mannose-1-phosphate guanylyltransferase
VRTVEHFCEKPSLDQAADLLRRRCLWNTFVTVGRVDAFEALIQAARPDIWAAFDAIRHLKSPREEAQAAEQLYIEMPPCDFSREVLSAQPGRLGVVTLSRNAGWTDLGQPSRVLAVLGRQGLPMPRLRATG